MKTSKTVKPVNRDSDLAHYVLTPTGYEHESTYPVPAPPELHKKGWVIPKQPSRE